MPRSGTTYLYHVLKYHPSYFLPARKELSYFSYHFNKPISYYLSHFKGIEDDQIGFDISPIQYFDPDSWSRIKVFSETAKVILIVREPNDWLDSYAKHAKIINGDKNVTVEQLLESGFEHNFDGIQKTYEIYDGLLKKNAQEIKEVFGDKLLLLNYSTLVTNPLTFFQEIENFLCVDNIIEEKHLIKEKINSSNRKQVLILEKLMQSKFFIWFITKCIPKKIIESVRLKLDKMLAKNSNSNKEAKKDNKNYLPQDKLFYENIFQ